MFRLARAYCVDVGKQLARRRELASPLDVFWLGVADLLALVAGNLAPAKARAMVCSSGESALPPNERSHFEIPMTPIEVSRLTPDCPADCSMFLPGIALAKASSCSSERVRRCSVGVHDDAFKGETR